MVRRALILLAAHACASSAPPVHTAPPVPEFPCTLEGHQVALESLTMMEPRASDDAQYPFAQVSRAAHIRIEPPVRVITFVRAELETSMLRLHGLASDGNGSSSFVSVGLRRHGDPVGLQSPPVARVESECRLAPARASS